MSDEMTVQFAPGTTIEGAAEMAVKIRGAIRVSYFLVFNGHEVLVLRRDSEEDIIRKYRKRVETQNEPAADR